jgi:hypothetical protein
MSLPPYAAEMWISYARRAIASGEISCSVPSSASSCATGAVSTSVISPTSNVRIALDDDYTFAAKVGAKYNADLQVHDQPGESRVVVTIDPVKIHPVDMT